MNNIILIIGLVSTMLYIIYNIISLMMSDLTNEHCRLFVYRIYKYTRHNEGVTYEISRKFIFALFYNDIRGESYTEVNDAITRMSEYKNRDKKYKKEYLSDDELMVESL